MFIRFTRKGAAPGHVLTITRDDGSVTTTRSNVPAEHDFVHYAVETTLGLRESFYGLVARGYDIQDFAVPGAVKKLQLPLQAGQTEFIVGLLQIERLNGTPYADFNAELRRACESANAPPPPAIGDEDLQVIRSMIDNLMSRWVSAGPNGVVELEFAAEPRREVR